MIDTTLLGTLTAEISEKITELFDDQPDGIVNTALVVLEVDWPERTEIVVRCSDVRGWIMEAILHEALDEVEHMRSPGVVITDDE